MDKQTDGQMDGQTDGGDCNIQLTNAVGNKPTTKTKWLLV